MHEIMFLKTLHTKHAKHLYYSNYNGYRRGTMEQNNQAHLLRRFKG